MDFIVSNRRQLVHVLRSSADAVENFDSLGGTITYDFTAEDLNDKDDCHLKFIVRVGDGITENGVVTSEVLNADLEGLEEIGAPDRTNDPDESDTDSSGEDSKGEREGEGDEDTGDSETGGE